MNTVYKKPEIILISACLLGLATRYDGKSKQNNACLAALENAVLLPVCPEQLGGLPTPRDAAAIINGDGEQVLAARSKVLTKKGLDVTENFTRGAAMVAQIGQSLGVKKIYLKAKSPSCAVNGKIGVTAALLKQKGFILQEF